MLTFVPNKDIILMRIKTLIFLNLKVYIYSKKVYSDLKILNKKVGTLFMN